MKHKIVFSIAISQVYKKSNFPYNEQEGKIWLHDDDDECFFS